MVTADGSRPVSDFPATISKKLNKDPLLKSTDNRYVFGENIYGVRFLLRHSVVVTRQISQTITHYTIPALPLTMNLQGRSSSLRICCNDATNASIRCSITGTAAFICNDKHTDNHIN